MQEDLSTVTSLPVSQSAQRHPSLCECLRIGLTSYCVTGVIVALGVMFGLSAVKGYAGPRSPQHVPGSGNEFLDVLAQWDGQWYLEIATEGYGYDPTRPSSVNFFPVYPLLVGAVFQLTGMPAALAGLLVSHAFLIGAFVLLFAYVRQRCADGPEQLGAYVLLAFGFFPTTFFMRMIYTESTFIFLTILALYGMERKWQPIIIALVIGLATATRPVGVALILPFVLHVCQQGGFAWRTGMQLIFLVPMASWGLLEYMLFLQVEFGEPLAFVQTSSHWWFRPSVGLSEKSLALLTGEPIWAVYQSSSLAFWKHHAPDPSSLFSLQFANPLFFVLAVALVGFGAMKRWLSRYELLLAIGLLLISYISLGYRGCMTSQGRYVSAAFPIYLVLGNLFCRVPATVSLGVLGVFAAYLAIYAAMFAAGYMFI